jgi:acyl-CoA synthetase (AMP-forming)/AMP-acid ligase II
MVRLEEILTLAAAQTPDKASIIVPGGEAVSYRELDRRASAFAGVVRERGGRPGDRMVLANGNTPGFFAALFGTLRAGLTAIPVDANLAARELSNIMQHARPLAVVVDKRSVGAFTTMGRDVPLWALDADTGVPWHDLDRIAAPPPATLAGPDAAAAEAALLLYTSGTTASPKGVLHGHAGVLAKLAAIQGWFGLDRDTTSLCVLPTNFGHGLIAVCLTTFHYGGTLVLSRPFDVELLQRLLSLVEQYNVNVFSSVPAIIRLLMRYSSGPAPRSLRFVTCASAPLHPEEVDAFEKRFGVPLLNCYGITEGGTWSAMTPPTGERDRQSVGTAVGCRMRAVDDQRAALSPGEIGHLEIAGPSLMLGYYQDAEATARTLVDGWLATGDLGYVDAAGRVYISGRSKELIIRAGANVYPSEIEGVLMRHPGVAEAYVVGLHHPILGEKVAACVVRKATSTVARGELIAHCREHLAPYKCPEEIEFVDAVPKTSRGKVTRASLQAMFARQKAP